mmetsp:Transcript_20867/g.65233  ORF Transcript_20867/g.65233 Transcript_20867/m.65233 type:complete len:253 (-) Transcript_20867:315-1073(-)
MEAGGHPVRRPHGCRAQEGLGLHGPRLAEVRRQRAARGRLSPRGREAATRVQRGAGRHEARAPRARPGQLRLLLGRGRHLHARGAAGGERDAHEPAVGEAREEPRGPGNAHARLADGRVLHAERSALRRPGWVQRRHGRACLRDGQEQRRPPLCQAVGLRVRPQRLGPGLQDGALRRRAGCHRRLRHAAREQGGAPEGGPGPDGRAHRGLRRRLELVRLLRGRLQRPGPDRQRRRLHGEPRRDARGLQGPGG